MNTDLWVYLIVFITVFILASVVFLKKERKRKRTPFDQGYTDVQVEVYEAAELEREAKLGIEIATKAQKEVEDMKRVTNEKLKELELKLKSEKISPR